MNDLPLTKKQILLHPVYCLAFGFGSGFAPKAPGTVGTLLAIPLYIALASLPFAVYVVATIVAMGVGIYLCGETARAIHKHDHPGIVWDEFVGFWIAMMALPANDWRAIVLGFALFRLFDIAKPWPVSIADKKVKGGLGIMLDDILAGVLAAIIGGLLWHLGLQYGVL
ncbi:phosphatidylglycerophosphatase A [Pleionea sp. CnH1-48]|uniref:phosphatidylglycerophosphatase A family protein n=1 Tax=Pleionea sp. CnH1-48 TaxID=2954494 RepID=UPI002096B8CB|nr:phosphatidylglycerophosphatase A [Pleionea sp. CnH1-48]MCO7225738.1 phosphatidylglycerophosphatase A [Pleionea sp. CnH1-48]